MPDNSAPPSGVEPKNPPQGAPGQTGKPGGGKGGPGGLSGGVDTGANEPGRTGGNGREDA